MPNAGGFPWAQRIRIRELALLGFDNVRIAQAVQAPTAGVTSYLKAHDPRITGHGGRKKPIDIPLDKLTPRARALVLRFEKWEDPPLPLAG
jgi:hypothetical protein